MGSRRSTSTTHSHSTSSTHHSAPHQSSSSRGHESYGPKVTPLWPIIDKGGIAMPDIHHLRPFIPNRSLPPGRVYPPAIRELMLRLPSRDNFLAGRPPVIPPDALLKEIQSRDIPLPSEPKEDSTPAGDALTGDKRKGCVAACCLVACGTTAPPSPVCEYWSSVDLAPLRLQSNPPLLVSLGPFPWHPPRGCSLNAQCECTYTGEQVYCCHYRGRFCFIACFLFLSRQFDQA